MIKHSLIKIASVLMALLVALSIVPTFSAEVNNTEPAEVIENTVTYATIDEFICEIKNGEITVTGYIGSETEIRIRDTLGGYPVTGIADGAFKNNENIKVVYIYDSIKTIGESAFENCTALWYVQINGGSKLIGTNAFKNTALYNQDRFWEDGLLISSGSKILLGTKEDLEGIVRVPYKVMSIAGGAFANCKNIEGIYLYEDNLKIIGNYAFENCENLKGVKIPASVNFIGADAFNGCEKAEVYSVYETDFIKKYCENEKLTHNVLGRYSIYNEEWDITLYADDDLAIEVEEVIYTEEEMRDIVKSLKGATVRNAYTVRAYDPISGIDMPKYNDFTLKVPLKGETFIEIEKNYDENSELSYSTDPWYFDEIKDGYVEFDYYNNSVVADVTLAYYSTTDEVKKITASLPTAFELKTLTHVMRNEENDHYFQRDIDSNIPEGKSFSFVHTKHEAIGGLWAIPSNTGISIKVPTDYEKNVAYVYSITEGFLPIECETIEGFVEYTIPRNSSYYIGCVVAGIEKEEPTEATTTTEPDSSRPEASEPVTTEPAEDATPSTSDSIPTAPAEKTEPTQAVTTPDETQEPSSSKTPTETTPDEDDYLLGDVDRDGKLSIRDATLIQKYLAKLVELDKEQIIIADITLDKKVNIKDVTTIQKKIAKLI